MSTLGDHKAVDPRGPEAKYVVNDGLSTLGDDASVNVPAPDPKILLEAGSSAQMPPGITRVPDGTSVVDELKRLGLLWSDSPGGSCCGQIINQGQIGVIERQGHIRFALPGQYCILDPWAHWCHPPALSLDQPILRTKGLMIVSLNQRETAVARDKDGKSLLLKQGRYFLHAPATLLPYDPYAMPKIISLVGMERHTQVDRFSFFNVPQGEVAGITLPNGQIRILQPGVHIVENAKFERFLPTIPIQSKLKKDVITSDQVTVALEVDITTQLVECARFLRMSVAPQEGKGGKDQGCKDLYDALEEPAQSYFIDTFSKYRYYEGRTRQGEEESKFEDNALHVLDREAIKYGGRVLKVNILKFRADSVEQAYAQHNKQQIELEHKKASQARQFEIEDNEQKHKHQMTERDERALTQKQVLEQEREILRKQHANKMAFEDAKAWQIKRDLEVKADGERKIREAQAKADALKTSEIGSAEADAGRIRVVADANARQEELRTKTKVEGIEKMAKALAGNKELLEMERQKMLENANIQKLEAVVRGGARVVPVEVLQLFQVTDEAALKRLQNAATMQAIQGSQGRWASDKKARD